ncbi:MAG: pyruvate kinase [candidate division KSB1 bacterium]|nr:pyruvate kinase [candidate division KSB1 bacterium]
MRRTKIVCTIGPASEDESVLRELIRAGMDVARLNFSHSTLEQHAARAEKIRRLSRELRRPVAILQDLSGPKIRIGKLENDSAELRPGDDLELRPGSDTGNPHLLFVDYPYLLDDLKAGDRVLLGDGQVELRVTAVERDGVRCQVVVGGQITSRKGINIPGGRLRIRAMSQKDWDDLDFGLQIGVDLVALSFVRSPEDILEVKDYLHRKGKELPVIAKIEKQEAIDRLEDILAVADGAIVARGDLAVETALERVPLVQKEIIRRCNRRGVPVVTATQMLRSMVDSPRPTRAEATDVANAVLDGSDALMLSEETAVGRYPVESVRVMDQIIRAAEEVYPFWHGVVESGSEDKLTVAGAVGRAANLMARDLGAVAILTPTESGSTARLVARYRPASIQIAVTSREETFRAMCLVWGVYPILTEEFRDTDEMVARCIRVAKEAGLLREGDRVIVTAGTPVGVPGRTNLIRAEVVS